MPPTRKPLNVGLILECGPQGADKKVCEHLARMIAQEANQEIELSCVTLDNKKNLIANCGEAAANLLKEGCERVIIVWDLYPSWRDKEPCRKEDRESIMKSLAEAGVRSRQAHLVCILEELEAWLLADGRALSAFLSTPEHPVNVVDNRWSENVSNPKREMKRIFTAARRAPYNDLSHAGRIVRRLPDLTKIRRCATFRRFEAKLLGHP